MSAFVYFILVRETVEVGPYDPYAMSNRPRPATPPASIDHAIAGLENEDKARVVVNALNAQSHQGHYPGQPVFICVDGTDVPKHDRARWTAAWARLDDEFRNARSPRQSERDAAYRREALDIAHQLDIAAEAGLQIEQKAEPSAEAPGGLNGDMPDQKGYVKHPVDPTAYAPVIELLNRNEALKMKLTGDKVRRILEREAPHIRHTRPFTKQGKPNPHRLLVHRGDWDHYVSSQMDGKDPSPDEFEERKGTIRGVRGVG